jgi:hypothetical protein
MSPPQPEHLPFSDVRAPIKKLQSTAEALRRVPASDIRDKVRTYVQDMTRPVVGGIGLDEALRTHSTQLHVSMRYRRNDPQRRFAITCRALSFSASAS